MKSRAFPQLKPAAVSGKVTKGDEPANRPVIALIRLPFSVAKVPYELQTVTGDVAGTFKLGGLAPGEYRILAVPYSDRYRLDEPFTLDGLLTKAKSIMLEANGFQNVSLDLLVP